MRGPNYKRTGDVRRTWRCPKCGTERKFSGEITTIQCGCQAAEWMQIVTERTNAPRPIQRPSDVERHPIDFGIEPNPVAPQKPEATIIKSAISRDDVPAASHPEVESMSQTVPDEPVVPDKIEPQEPEDDWGEGIL